MQHFWASHINERQRQLDLKQMETNQHLNLPNVHLSGPVMGSASYCASADAHRVSRTNCNTQKKGLFLSPLQVPNVFAVLPNGLGRAAQKGNCPLRLGCKYTKSTRLDLTWARHFDIVS